MSKKNKKGLITGLIVGGAIFSVSSILLKRKRKKSLLSPKRKQSWWQKLFKNK